MKTLFFAIALFLSASQMMAQQPSFEEAVASDDLGYLAGRTFYKGVFTNEDERLDDSAIIHTLIPPKFASLSKTIYLDSNASKTGVQTIRLKDGGYRFKITKATERLRKCTDTTRPGIYISTIEMPANYKTIDAKDFQDGTYTYIHDTLVSGPKLLKTSVGSKPEHLDSNEYFLPAGGHTKFKEVTCYHTNQQTKLVQTIQEALNKAGYDVKENNELGAATRLALIDYQKKHGLPVGNMNVETLIHLKIPGF